MKKILIIQHRRLGDILLTTPVIDVLYKHFVDKGEKVQVDFLVEKQFKELLIGNPYLTNIYGLDKKEKWNGENNFLSIIFKIRKQKYDYIFDFFGNPTSAWVSFFSGAKNTYSFDFRFRKHLYKKVIKRPTEIKYAVDFKMDLLKDLGIENGFRKTSMYLEKELIDNKKNMFFDSGWNGTDKVVGLVVPNVRDRTLIKNWIFERYQEISNRFISELGCFVVLLWGPGEEENAKKIKKDIKDQNKCMMIPKGSIRDVSGFIKNCDAVLTICSGDKHIAVALDIPTLTMFGSTNSFAGTPPNSKKHLAIFAEGVDCLGCEHNKCPKSTQECMEKLSVDMVFEKMKELLNNIEQEKNV